VLGHNLGEWLDNHMSGSIQWDEKRLEKLKKLWEMGLPISQIGEKLGVSRNAIAGKVHRMGLPKRQSPIAGGGKSGGSSSRKAKTTPMLSRADLPLKLALRNITWSRSKCSWPIGDPQSTDFHFCGDDVVTGKPYCNSHCFDAYTTNRESGNS
jgi:GcrA cell cycle regulator